MALTLIDPSPAAVIQHAGGLITARCADFLGAARGTLSTEADSGSAAGNVVRDDQALSVPTTFVSTSSRFSSASDTVVIPNASWGYETDVVYTVFLGLRMEGAPPSNARYQDTVMRHNSGVGYGVGVGLAVGASYFQNIDWINNETCAEYQLRRVTSNYQPTSITGDFKLRAWGTTGGTVSILLDTVYLIPIGSNDGGDQTRWRSQFPNSYEALLLLDNGVLGSDDDQDDLWWPGKHSVFHWQAPWAPDGMDWGQLVDFQEDDSEPTVANMNGDGEWDGSFGGPADPRSYLWILAGGTHIPAVTVITDPFDVTADSAATVWADIDGYIREVQLGVQSQVQYFWDPGLTRRGFFVESGSGLATCYFGSSIGQPVTGGPGPFPPATVFRADVFYGEMERDANLSSTDPRNYRARFVRDMECWEQVCKFRLRDNLGRTSAALGQFAQDVSGGIDPSTMWSGWLQWDGTDLDLYFVGGYEGGSLQSPWAGPASITTSYALDDWYWLRVQKQGYMWRARAWADGGSEPSTWDLEERQPILKDSTGLAYVDYPYDDNWSASVTNDTIMYEPRGGPSGIADDHLGAFGGCGIRCTRDYNIARARVECDDYQLDWNPSSGTPGDMSVRVDKYDGLSTYGSVTLPYGAHRIVAGSLDHYTFNGDTDGINTYAWKDAGQPDFMTAGLGIHYQRAPFAVGGVLSLSHLRVANRYGTRVTLRG